MTDATSIAIVEDDPEIRALLAAFLEGEGFRSRCVEGGAALERLFGLGCDPVGVCECRVDDGP